MKDEAENKDYLEGKLSELVQRKLIRDFRTTLEKNEYCTNIQIGKSDVKLVADMKEYMEVLVNDYYREVTDYLMGDYRQTIDWYLAIIEKLASGDYGVQTYSRGGKVICRSLLIKLDKSTLTMGDRRNHFTLFAQKGIMPGRNLASIPGRP